MFLHALGRIRMCAQQFPKFWPRKSLGILFQYEANNIARAPSTALRSFWNRYPVSLKLAQYVRRIEKAAALYQLASIIETLNRLVEALITGGARFVKCTTSNLSKQVTI